MNALQPIVYTLFVTLFFGATAATVTNAQVAPQDLFQLTSTEFAPGGPIPKRFTCDDENASPTLQIAGVPVAAKSLVLIMDDPDAPRGTFTHWLLWNMSPDLKEIVGGATPRNAVVGRNDFGKINYSGPCPPSGEHRYYFRIFALDTNLNLPAGASRKALEKALQGHVLGQTTLMGRYARTAATR